MKTAFISPFYPYRGGIAQFGDSLYLSLSNKCRVLAVNYTRLYPRIFFPGTTQYVSKHDRNRNVHSNRIIDSVNPISWRKTVRLVKQFKADVVLVSYWMPFFIPALGSIAGKLRKSGIKTVALMHNVTAHDKIPMQNRLLGKFADKFSGFIVLNSKSAEELRTIKPDAIQQVIQHPFYDHYGDRLDTITAKEKLGISSESNVILFFGFIRPYKGLDILIEAMKYLDDKYVLLIAGEPYGDFSIYEKLISDSDLSSKVIRHVRYIPESEIPLFFSASDVCVLPYRSATQSGITGIAYHFDLPVIASGAGGLSEDILNMKTGIVIKDISPVLLADVIKKYFNDNLKVKFIPGIISYRQERSWDSFADRFIKFSSEIGV